MSRRFCLLLFVSTINSLFLVVLFSPSNAYRHAYPLYSLLNPCIGNTMDSLLPSSFSFNNNDNSLALSTPHNIDARTCHIHTLPTEILLSVFSLLPPGDVFYPSAAQWVVGRVCRQWSQVAASCYDLWRCITVTVFSAVWCPNSVGLLREVISRSGEHALHITFDMSGIDMTSEDFGHEIYNQDGRRILPFFEARSLQLLAVLMDFSPRWVSADFRGLVPSCARALDAITERLPRLEALTIDCDDSVQVKIYAFCDAPRLRTVCIDYAPVQMMDPCSLVSLVSPSGLFATEMLSECPKLESLTAYGIIPSFRDAGRRTTLKSITYISLGHDDQLVVLDLPNLIELELATSVCPELTVANFLEHSRCPLRKMSLLLCQCDCLQLVDILRLTPTVEEIVIEFDDFFCYFDGVDSSSEDSDSDDDDDNEYVEDKAGRRRESGLRIGLESLMDFIGIIKDSKLPSNPLLSLPCLRQFCLSFEFLEPDEAQLLNTAFCGQTIVQDFQLRGIVLSLNLVIVGM
ncbi:hypothetical protein BDZ89DRAFT_252769 [Hymenopellis radicata]|nr:hypothetical protein BDZ89DRAFT_252769 [Hymenopellis radicata]